MSKLFKLPGFSLLFICGLFSLLAACGEETPRPDASPTSSVSTAAIIITKTATPVPATTVASFTATPPPPTPVATATVLTVASILAATISSPKAEAVVGDLPAPPQGRKLNLTLEMLQRVQKKLIGKPATTDLSGLTVGAYAATGQPVDAFDYYRVVMPAKGWTESHKYDNRFGIYFEKGRQVAIVSAIGIPDDTTVVFLAGFIPEVRGQVKGGEVLVLLGQGPLEAFEMLIK